MKQVFLLFSWAIIGIGVYLKFFYDVPDAQESINFFTGGFLMIMGTSSMLINLFWSDSHK